MSCFSSSPGRGPAYKSDPWREGGSSSCQAGRDLVSLSCKESCGCLESPHTPQECSEEPAFQHLDKLGGKKNKRKEKRTCILIPLVANFFYFLNKGACFFFFFTLCSANYLAGRATTAQAKAGDDELENN